MTTIKKIMLVIFIISILFNIIVICSIFIRPQRRWIPWHPHPKENEFFEVKDPATQEVIIKIVTLKWTDDSRKFPRIMFKQADGTIWSIEIPVLDCPNPQSDWLIRNSRDGKDDSSEIPVSRIVAPSDLDRPEKEIEYWDIFKNTK